MVGHAWVSLLTSFANLHRIPIVAIARAELERRLELEHATGGRRPSSADLLAAARASVAVAIVDVLDYYRDRAYRRDGTGL